MFGQDVIIVDLAVTACLYSVLDQRGTGCHLRTLVLFDTVLVSLTHTHTHTQTYTHTVRDRPPDTHTHTHTLGHTLMDTQAQTHRHTNTHTHKLSQEIQEQNRECKMVSLPH